MTSERSSVGLWRWHPRVLAKDLLKRYCLIPAYCKRCGRRSEGWDAPDTLYHSIVPSGEITCLQCFQTLALEKGVCPETHVRGET